MAAAAPRRARVYDRCRDGEGLQGPKSRFAEVDAAAESLRPGAVVALSVDCDELLAVQRSGGANNWVLTTVSTEWSSRGESGWHTHAGDYAVESLEPSCLFRVVREGPHIFFVSLAADGKLLCASSSSGDSAAADSLGLAPSSSSSWVAAGASWEQHDGVLCNSRWPDKVLPVCVLHVTCLPTTQLQRVEEFYGGLLHDVTAEKTASLRQLRDLEAERNAARADAARWRQQYEQQQRCAQLAAAAAPQELQLGVTAQLAELQQQLEKLAADGQERARMSICLRTIKEITDLVRQSATPSTDGSPTLPADLALGPAPVVPDPHAPYSPTASDDMGESRLVDFLGSRPEAADPLERVLEPSPEQTLSPDSPPKRVLRSLSNAGSIEGLDSATTSSLRSGCQPLSESMSLAVKALAVGSPRQADGVAQYIATGPMSLRASQQGVKPSARSSRRSRSSFLQRPPATAEDLFPLPF